MKKFYGSPWFIWAIVIFVMAITGTLNAAALVILGLFTLALLGGSHETGEIYEKHKSSRYEKFNS